MCLQTRLCGKHLATDWAGKLYVIMDPSAPMPFNKMYRKGRKTITCHGTLGAFEIIHFTCNLVLCYEMVPEVVTFLITQKTCRVIYC